MKKILFLLFSLFTFSLSAQMLPKDNGKTYQNAKYLAKKTVVSSTVIPVLNSGTNEWEGINGDSITLKKYPTRVSGVIPSTGNAAIFRNKILEHTDSTIYFVDLAGNASVIGSLKASVIEFNRGSDFLGNTASAEYYTATNDTTSNRKIGANTYEMLERVSYTPPKDTVIGSNTYKITKNTVWKNTSISVMLGQTVDFLYRNNKWDFAVPPTVKTFGAFGDNVNNDAPAIQAAFNYANIYGVNVIFPEGNFRINNSIIIPKDFYNVVKGAGEIKTTISYYGVAGGSMFYCEKLQYSDFRDFQMTGRNLAAYAIRSDSVTYTNFNHLRLLLCTESMLKYGYGWENSFTNLLVQHGKNGIYATFECNANVFIKCAIGNLTGTGLILENANRTVKVIGCTFESIAQAGIYVAASNSIDIDNCYFEECATSDYTYTTTADGSLSSLAIRSMIHLNGTGSPTFLGQAFVNRGVRITNCYISQAAGSGASFIFANAVEGLTVSNNNISQTSSVALMRILDNYSISALRDCHLSANINFTKNVDKIGSVLTRYSLYYKSIIDFDLDTKNIWTFDNTYSQIVAGGGTYREYANQATIIHSTTTNVFYKTITLPTEYQNKTVQFKFKLNTSYAGRSFQFWFNTGAGNQSYNIVNLANGDNDLYTLLTPTTSTVSVGFRMFGLTGDTVTLSNIELNLVGAEKNNKVDYFEQYSNTLSIASKYFYFGFGTKTPAYKVDIDAKTGSAGNPFRAQGILQGAKTDSIGTFLNGVLRQMALPTLTKSVFSDSCLSGITASRAVTTMSGETQTVTFGKSIPTPQVQLTLLSDTVGPQTLLVSTTSSTQIQYGFYNSTIGTVNYQVSYRVCPSQGVGY